MQLSPRIKNQFNIKLSTRTIAQIRELAAQRGESQANVVSIAVDRMAREETMNTLKQSGKLNTRGQYGEPVHYLHRVIWDAEKNNWRWAEPTDAPEDVTWGAWDSTYGWLAPFEPEDN